MSESNVAQHEVKERTTVELQPTNYQTRRGCLFCGETTNKDLVNAEVLSAFRKPGESELGAPLRTGYVVCERCLQRGPDDLQRELYATADGLRTEADWMYEIAANLPTLPSVDEWRDANRQREDDLLRGRRGDDAAAEVDRD